MAWIEACCCLYRPMRRLVAISLVIGLAGCVTPSIPIPPPDPAAMTFRLTGLGGPDSAASFAYDADANYSDATVFVFNRDLGVGIITTAKTDGSVDPTAP